jgi:hypothetical protein
MAIIGSRLIQNIPTDVRPGDWDSVVPLVTFQAFPLTALFYLAPAKPVEDPTFSWFDKVLPIISFRLQSGASGGATTLTLDSTFTDDTGAAMDYTHIVKGTVLKNVRTGEEVIVTATPSSNTISVQRGIGSVPATSMNAGDILQFQGVTASQRKVATSKVNYDPSKRMNNVQKFTEIAVDQSLEFALTAKRVEGFSIEDQRIEALYRLGQGIEEAFLSGTPTLSSGVPTSFSFDGDIAFKTGGFKYLLDTYAPNRVIVNSNPDGIVTEDTLNLTLQKVFNFDSGKRERLALCGNGFIQVVNELASKAIVRYSDPIVEYFGLKVFEWLSPYGTIYLISHPLFSSSNAYWTHSNTAYDRTYSALLIDTDTIFRREMMPIIEKDNIQPNNELAKMSAFVTIVGLEVNPIVYNALLLNFKLSA